MLHIFAAIFYVIAADSPETLAGAISLNALPSIDQKPNPHILRGLRTDGNGLSTSMRIEAYAENE
jgi:hypothetical protein